MMSVNEINLPIGKLPVETRLHDSSQTVIAAADPAPDNLKALASVLHKISAGVSNFLSAAACCEREPVRQQATAIAMFKGDRESSQQILKYMDEAVERIAAVRAHLQASQV
jgi:hypothetical protein